MDSQPPPPPPAPTGPRLLLGIFIVGQIVFLAVINLLDLARDARSEMKDKTASALERVVPGGPREGAPLHDATDGARGAARRWSQATGQLQGWSLFAPNIGRHCVFPLLELRWDEDPRSAPAAARPLAPLAASSPLEA